jgi:hypothetical protein
LEGDIEKTIEQFQKLADYFRPMTIDTIAYLNQAIVDGSKKILVEGANATMLDIDFGIFILNLLSIKSVFFCQVHILMSLHRIVVLVVYAQVLV